MPQQKLAECVPSERVSELIQDAQPYQVPATIWTSAARPYVTIRRGSLNIISCNSKQDVVGQSLKLAQDICRSEIREADPWPYNPEDVIAHPKVFYLNTAASRDDIQNEIMGLWPGAQEWSVKRDRYLRDNPAKDDNLVLYHVPSGKFNDHFAAIMNQRKANMASIIILNSFEFACRTARHRDDLVYQLKELRDLGCTVIVFTQEAKRRIDKQARGPMALLRMQSEQTLDQSIFEKLEYAKPVGSTHANEEEYYASTGESGREYFASVRERSTTKEEMLTSDEIHDTVHDDIDLPQELVEGGVYSMDGELLFVNPDAGKQTMNQYRVQMNGFEPLTKILAPQSTLSQPSPFKGEGDLI
jgi:hypothetical protein